MENRRKLGSNQAALAVLIYEPIWFYMFVCITDPHKSLLGTMIGLSLSGIVLTLLLGWWVQEEKKVSYIIKVALWLGAALLVISLLMAASWQKIAPYLHTWSSFEIFGVCFGGSFFVSFISYLILDNIQEKISRSVF